MAISKLANGFYTFSDNHFKAMRKQDLINYIRTIEKNWENALITNAIQYDNCKRLLAEERNKAIDEFAKKFIFKAVCEGCSGCCDCYENETQNTCEDWKYYMEIAEQMKVGANNVNDR